MAYAGFFACDSMTSRRNVPAFRAKITRVFGLRTPDDYLWISGDLGPLWYRQARRPASADGATENLGLAAVEANAEPHPC